MLNRHQNVAAFIQSEIETTCPGLIINLRVVPMNQRLDDMTNGNFQLAIHRTGSSVPNIVAKLGQYTTGHALNYGKYSNAEYDASITRRLLSSPMRKPSGTTAWILRRWRRRARWPFRSIVARPASWYVLA